MKFSGTESWIKLDGILLLDKPLGMSSNRALQRVKRLYGAAKAGHTGSLDPLATGLLPICFGHATKVSGLLLEADKHYEVTGRLGIRTNTGDAEGEVIESRPVPALSEADIETVLAGFRGEYDQVPPMYSAIKINGQRLYKLARKGKEVERAPRRVILHEIRLLSLEADSFSLYVHCSKGTYIRTLVEDIGQAIGCGASVTQLRRVGLGPWLRPQMHSLEALYALADAAGEDNEARKNALNHVILPTDSALADYPAVMLDEESTFHIRHGHPVFVPKAPQDGRFRLYGPDNLFLGIGEVLDDGRVAPRRLFAAL